MMFHVLPLGRLLVLCRVGLCRVVGDANDYNDDYDDVYDDCNGDDVNDNDDDEKTKFN